MRLFESIMPSLADVRTRLQHKHIWYFCTRLIQKGGGSRPDETLATGLETSFQGKVLTPTSHRLRGKMSEEATPRVGKPLPHI